MFVIFPLHGAPADVAAVESLGPVDASDGLVGARLRLRTVPPSARDVEHASAIGEDAAAVAPGAGVEDLDAFDGAPRRRGLR